MRYFVLYATPEYLYGQKMGIHFNLVETAPEPSAMRRYQTLAVKSNEFGIHLYNQDTSDYLPRIPTLGILNGSKNFVDTRLIFRDVVSTSVFLIGKNIEEKFSRFVDVVRNILGNKDERICLFLNSDYGQFKVSSVSWCGGLPATRIRVTDENDQNFSVMIHINRKNVVTHNIHVCTTSLELPDRKKVMSYIELIVGTKKNDAIPHAIELLDQHVKNSEETNNTNGTLKFFNNFPSPLNSAYLAIEDYLRRLQYELFGV